MAKNVSILVSGGTKKVVEISTPAQGLEALGLTGNYAASINGNPADMGAELTDFSFVTYSANVKGNAKPKVILDTPTVTAIHDQDNEVIFLNGIKLTKAQTKKLVNAGLTVLEYKTI